MDDRSELLRTVCESSLKAESESSVGTYTMTDKMVWMSAGGLVPYIRAVFGSQMAIVINTWLSFFMIKRHTTCPVTIFSLLR